MNKNNKIWLSTTYYQQSTNQQHASHQHYLCFAFVISLEHELSRGGEVGVVSKNSFRNSV